MRYDNHNHSRYSNLRLRDALATPEQLIDKAIELGLAGISISDHECVSGHVKANRYYYEVIKDKYPNFKIGLSNEIYLVNERPTDNHYHYVLTPIDEMGYHQIKELSSIAWLNSYTANGLTRVDTLKSELEEIVRREPGHLIASSACIGSELGKNILELTRAEKCGDEATAAIAHDNIVNYILWNLDLFGDNFYIEVQPGVSKEQIIVNQRLLSIANCFNIKMIPTSDTHYLRPEDRFVHKSFLNSENKEREVDAFYQDAYLHTDEEMIKKFALSGFDELFVQKMFENSMEIYDKVTMFSLFHPQQVPKVDVKYFMPRKAPLELESYKTLSSMYESRDDIDRYWVNVCINKLKEIGKFNEKYLAELEEEAEVKKIIGEKLGTNMYAYPVCLAHYIEMMWDCGSSIGAGRGSACSALNHYLLGITQLDPLEWNFPFFRYMNRDTDGLGDIDIDVCPSKVSMIIDKIRQERGKKFNSLITNELIRNNLGATYVCTFGTESTKSAILTACRGYRSEEFPDGIDVDTAQYLSSLVPSERGFLWTLDEVVNGNEEKERKPVTSFLNEVNQYPGLLDIMMGIEGCISRRGRHASGVLFNGEDPFEFNAYMKTPSGEVVSQYDLHDAEYCGAVKMDILVTEVQDKIVQTIKLLQRDGYIESYLSLKEAYNKYLHPDVLPIDDLKVWKVIDNAEVLDLFQLDSEVGRQGAKKIKPDNMIELSSVNGLIRLMTTEKGAETWLDKYVRFKKDIKSLDIERNKYRLSEAEKLVLDRYLKTTKGIGISQEQMMRVLMDEDICNFSLKEANKARKIVSKKKMKEIPIFKEKVFKTAKSQSLANYVWDYVVGPGLGYAFSDIHSLSYSFVGFQTAYLATKWNPIYWNTSCLIVNSGALEEDEPEIVSIYEKEDYENYSYEDLPNREGKKKEKSSDYAKIAKAIGEITNRGINISLIDINKSGYTFEPNLSTNSIMYGMKALSGLNRENIDKIIMNRPYNTIFDFIQKCKLDKRSMLSLIKSGAFDNLDYSWANTDIHPRILAMGIYLSTTADLKSKLTLSNMPTLIKNNILPDSLQHQKQIYNFTKYLRKNCKRGEYYQFDDICSEFYNQYYDNEYLEIINGKENIRQKTWDKIYDSEMDAIRDWIKNNGTQILTELNRCIFTAEWGDYADGNLSAWEMSSLCFYYHEHELSNVNYNLYGFVNFEDLSYEPTIDYYFKRNGREIPIFKTYKIIGTVICKDDTRSSITLLTTTGVTTVKFTKEYYAMYNRQISEVQEDGSKKVVEKSWFSRGNKLMITGFRREDTFVAKTYKNTPTHQLYLITAINDDGTIEMTHERKGQVSNE